MIESRADTVKTRHLNGPQSLFQDCLSSCRKPAARGDTFRQSI